MMKDVVFIQTLPSCVVLLYQHARAKLHNATEQWAAAYFPHVAGSFKVMPTAYILATDANCTFQLEHAQVRMLHAQCTTKIHTRPKFLQGAS